jgi:RimJ/RimL family protein N-acetyltransferase
MINTLEVLKDDVLTLIPSEDKDYIYELAAKYKYNTIDSKDKAIAIIDRYVKEIWVGESEGKRLGVIFLMYLPELDEWSLDAYVDDAAKGKNEFSYRAGKLIMDYFFENHEDNLLSTLHDVRNKPATAMCKRLGFKALGSVFFDGLGNFITMKVTRDFWELKRRFN